MDKKELLPHLFRTEYRRITSVLCKRFGFDHLEIAEDITSDTFLAAAETWGLKGTPDNPGAWLCTVAKNKAKDHLKRDILFTRMAATSPQTEEHDQQEADIDLSEENIKDSQLQMMFAICQPSLTTEAQIGLSLRILCGFGIEEIADAFLSNKDTINKRLFRAKEKLREQNVKIGFPQPGKISTRLQAVLTTLYLLFNEGYYSVCQNNVLRKELCLEAMRLTFLLLENEQTNLPPVNALFALMCFHASRFEARIDEKGGIIRYEDQDANLWNAELISRGKYHLNQASKGNHISKYHLEAAIAFWHTMKADTVNKWENILQLYNKLLQIEYSPVAAMNRTYAVSKARGKPEAIADAEKLQLINNHLYHALLGYLYTDIDNQTAMQCLEKALKLVKTDTEKSRIRKDLDKLRNKVIV